MRFFRRSLIALGMAAALPTIVFAAVGAFYLLRLESSQVESATLARSQAVMALADAELRSYVGAMRVLTTSPYMDSGAWEEFYSRIARVKAGNPSWATVRLYDVRAGAEIFDLRRPFAPPRPGPFPWSDELAYLRKSGEPLVGGIVMETEPLMYMHAAVIREAQLKYVLSIGLRPQVFQELLRSQVPAGTVAAIVDREGRFIARSHDYEHKVGLPATVYVRDAIHTGTQGFYRGVTWEGFRNYTAYSTSAWSGWSAHIAVASSLIDTPTSWSFVVAGIAGLGSALLGGVLIVVVLRDMSERRRAEETLRQSQKMEAVGQLTSGIAHDFNNLLTAIIGNLDMIRSRGGGNERLQRNVEHALEAARRGAKLTAQLLTFSRNQRMQLEPVDLEKLLAGMSGLLAQSVGPSIEIDVAIHPDARFVLSDANQLELALLNLAVNARDAMPAGGKLAIATRFASAGDVRSLPQHRYVEIKVTDQGVGMIEEVRARAMEPFFTTKLVGQGTGLGLAQVYGIVRESGGVVHIDSVPGQGTSVRLILPFAAVAEEPAAPDDAQQETAADENDTQGERTLLVVDDDSQVRRFMTESLRNLGYRVLDAADGAAGLSLLEDERCDLLLVDFAMPGMNGVEVARAAHAKQPQMKILMVSGYADDTAIEAAPAMVRLLRKPFDLAELQTAVAEMLNGDERVMA